MLLFRTPINKFCNDKFKYSGGNKMIIVSFGNKLHVLGNGAEMIQTQFIKNQNLLDIEESINEQLEQSESEDIDVSNNR